jgi:hypothetical protein
MLLLFEGIATFFRFGFFFLAAGLALRVELARMAAAAPAETPLFAWIDLAAAAKPIPFAIR